ncbi:GntR family transcriptional regulator [Pseudomonas sp. CG7]|uniref:FadR/GntR family transcriptional regulator n=1 Tax=Pseudomonas sp. CG7 TaxID=191007 RepID=UPI0020340E2D
MDILPKTAAERVANYRARKKTEGMTTLSLLVPVGDVDLFNEFAAHRRSQHREAVDLHNPTRRCSSMIERLTPGLSQQPMEKGDAPKLRQGHAEILVSTIIQRIAKLGWPVGMPLGSEAELMKTYKVSRAVLRQAIRLLAHDSIARVQRGAGGGLIVARPDFQATTRAIKVYLEYAKIGPGEIYATRKTLELATLDNVIECLDLAGEQRLREQIAIEVTLDGHAGTDELLRFHFLLGELNGDIALRLFTGVVLQLADEHSTFHSRSFQDRNAIVERVKQLHASIAEALIARDKEKAIALMAHYIGGIKNWLA